MSFRKLLCLMGIVAMFIAVALPAFAQWDPDVNGYSQFRYEYSDNDSDGDFDTRRVRLNWKDGINDQGTTVRVQLDFSDLLSFSDGGNKVSAKDIWVMHPFTEDWSALVGFTTVQFGYELEYSSSKRLPFERSKAARSFFPGERGLGAFLSYTSPESSNFSLNLNYVDGMDSWDRGDFDDAESFIARAEVPFGNGSAAGVSYMTSDVDVTTGTGASFSPDVWGAHMRYNSAGDGNRWAVQAEYYDGDWYEHKGQAVHDADGWYAQLEYLPEASSANPFYRYDEFNAGAASDYSRHTFGVAYEPWANNRLTLQVEDIDDEDDDTTFGVQWQVKYK